MLQTGRHGFDAGGLERRDDRLRHCIGRQVNIVDGATEQRIPHAAADETDFRAGPFQGIEDGRGFRRIHPGLRREPARHGRRKTSDRLTSMPAVAPQM